MKERREGRGRYERKKKLRGEGAEQANGALGVIRLLQQKYSQGFAEVTAKSLEGYVEGQESLQQVQ